jgi:hypothetical protein
MAAARQNEMNESITVASALAKTDPPVLSKSDPAILT